VSQVVDWLDYLHCRFLKKAQQTSTNINYFCIPLKRCIAILNLTILAWCLSPWQLLCLDHDHSKIEKGRVAITEYEDNNTFHGCDLDYISAWFDWTELQLQITNYQVCINDSSIIDNSVIQFASIKGRAPPEQ
jgi:hypothetical protein